MMLLSSILYNKERILVAYHLMHTIIKQHLSLKYENVFCNLEYRINLYKPQSE